MRRLIASVDGPPAALSVRDGRFRIVGRDWGHLTVEIGDGDHVVTALLPSGRTIHHVVAAGVLDQRVVLEGSPQPLVRDDDGPIFASAELAEGQGSMIVDGEGLLTVSPSRGRRGSLAVRIPDDPVPTIVRLPRSGRWGATVALAQGDGQVRCTAITNDPRFSTAMSYQASGLLRQAAELVEGRLLPGLRRVCTDEPVAAAHLAHLTRHVLEEEHLYWLADQAIRAPGVVDLAVAAADLAFRLGEDAQCRQLLRIADVRRRPIFTSTVFSVVHLGRRFLAEESESHAGVRSSPSDPYGWQGPRSAPLSGSADPSDLAVLLRRWGTLARRVDPNAPTLTLRSTSSYERSDTPPVEVELPPSSERPEWWKPGRAAPLRRSMATLAARSNLPEALAAPVEQAQVAADLDGVRRAVEHFVDDVASMAHGESSMWQRAVIDVLEDVARTFPLIVPSVEHARGAVRGLSQEGTEGVEVDVETEGRRLVSIPPYALLLTREGSSIEIAVEVPARSDEAYSTRAVVPLDLVVDEGTVGRWWLPTRSTAEEGETECRLTLESTTSKRIAIRISSSAIALEDVATIPSEDFERSLRALDPAARDLLRRGRGPR